MKEKDKHNHSCKYKCNPNLHDPNGKNGLEM